MEKLVSIIIPAYNVEKYIEDCLDSVSKQTYKNIEIIVIDDGSTDNTSEICKRKAEKESKIRYFYKNNEGVTLARNKGIEVANGQYIAFIDADDYIDYTMIEKLVMYIDEYDIVSCGVIRHNSANRCTKVGNICNQKYLNLDEMKSLLSTMIYDFKTERIQPLTPWLVNKLYKKEIIESFYKDIDSKITFAEDSAFLYRYILKCKSAIFLDEYLYNYRYRKDSAWHSKNDYMLENLNRVYISLKSEFGKHELKDVLILQLQKWIAIMTCNAINRHMGFNSNIRIPQYIMDTDQLKGKRICLYGAGNVGQDIHHQLELLGIPVELWVDRDYTFYREQGMDVCNIEMINKNVSDLILVAVKDKNVADRIIDDLAVKQRKNIKWVNPAAIY